ncbi:MAG: GNAT family N-acetyltransferase [Pseudomonadota bacterium]
MAIEFEIRPARAEEMHQLGLMGSYSYGGAFGDGPDNITATSNQPEWTLCAFDGATMATSFAAFPFTMRANGAGMAMAGISAVGTRPEYRRQGLLRKIMTQALADERDRGQSLACLWASQAAIYQRYGFAMMGANRHYQVDTVDIAFTDGDEGAHQVRRLTVAEGLDHAKAVYRNFIAPRFGYLHRSSVLWRTNVVEETDETGPIYLALAFDGDTPNGYIAYSLRAVGLTHRARSQEIVIKDFAWLNIDAYRSLWTYIGRHDLVGRVRWENAPMDDPAPELFMEPRMLHCEDREGSWMRMVDVGSALAQRGYGGASGQIRIGIVDDGLALWNNATWALAIDNGQARCEATSASAEVEISIKGMSSLFSGMRTPAALRQMGALTASDGDVAHLAQLFAVPGMPHCPDHY